MRIAILSGHFMPEIGYQEVELAKAFSKLGHKVRVITSTSVSPSSRQIVGRCYSKKYERICSYDIVRLKPLMEFRSNVIAYRCEIEDALNAFNPQLVIALAIPKFFPLYGLKYAQKKEISKVVIYGEVSENRRKYSMFDRLKSKLLDVGALITKSSLYRYSVRLADQIVLNTPKTGEIIKKYLSANDKDLLVKKANVLSLGFDPDQFYFDQQARIEIRSKLNIENDTHLFITATKIAAGKRLEEIPKIVIQLLGKIKSFKYLLVGFSNSGFSIKFREMISRRGLNNIIYCLDHVDSSNLRAYFSASDIGIWLQPSITIQQAMGTGLKLFLPSSPSLSHLLVPEITGDYYNSSNDLLKRIKTNCQPYLRESVYRYNQKFSYSSIADSILKLINF